MRRLHRHVRFVPGTDIDQKRFGAMDLGMLRQRGLVENSKFLLQFFDNGRNRRVAF
jgi:hypothetical protein